MILPPCLNNATVRRLDKYPVSAGELFAELVKQDVIVEYIEDDAIAEQQNNDFLVETEDKQIEVEIGEIDVIVDTCCNS
jgi:hypothetical protein